jgi:colanic acid/amylovoran biosynthesis glycosyltransferase
MSSVSRKSNGEHADTQICVVTDYLPAASETFIRSHVENLPARVVLIHGWRPTVDDRMVLSFPQRAVHKAWRLLTASGLQRETTAAYLQAFKRYRPAAVLAEYGPTGVQTTEACWRLGIPLVVHFHGYDASEYSVLKDHAETYPVMFDKAAAVVAVSRAMQERLISLGAPPEKVYYNPCGVDCSLFGGATPEQAPPVFVAVGRFVDKKAPQLTLSAFARVYREAPDARLRMIGDGPLLVECRELAEKLGISDGVKFLGVQPPAVVQEEMRGARCFVQHSVQASNGDCEGTPVGILEAGASGLPVVATRHAGIPDVVLEGETGFLVAEGDIDGMAEGMLKMIRSPELAGEMGRQARQRIANHFSKEHSLGQLWSIIESSILER